SSIGGLDGVTLAGTADVTAASSALQYITDGLTLDNGLIKIGWTCFLVFNGTQTLDGTGTIQFTDDNMNGLDFSGALITGGGTLTIGPGITVTGTNGAIDASLVNQGTIHSDVRGGQITIGGVRDSWVNQGLIDGQDGGTATLTGSWSNTGTIRETDATL